MFSLKVTHLLFLFIFHGYDCQRRIKNGEVVNAEKKYMVYLLKASTSPRSYEGWLCGGALVSPEFIVTSAACVVDVAHLYAIAGYNKYVPDTQIHENPCTKAKKKKIIQTCIHKSYNLKFEQPEVWSDIDIAVVKVESPYNFNDQSYETICSYTPSPIMINYAIKHQEPGIDALVLGWGHQSMYREEMDLTNYNQENLYYSPVLIQDKETCKEEYKDYVGMDEVIDRYMICTDMAGNINDAGGTIIEPERTAQGCLSPQTLHGEVVDCNRGNVDEDVLLIENGRKSLKLSNLTSNGDQNSNYPNNGIKNNVVDSNVRQNSSIINKTKQNILKTRRHNTRRNGICQNDHGGPLVTWIGAHEVLIGVASAFKISESRECIGPYLFTSTQCNGLFLDCILRSDTTRRADCTNVLLEQGFLLFEKHISWKYHPDGPADNERNVTTHSKEEKKEKAQDYNITEFVNTNITYKNVNTTYNTEHSNLIGMNKDINLGNTKPMNLTHTNFTNVDESVSVILTNVTSTKLTVNISTKLIKDTSTLYLTSASITNTEGTTTNLISKLTTITENTTTPKIASIDDIEDRTTTILMKTASTNLGTTTTLTKASITNIANTTTKSLMQNATTNLGTTTTLTKASITNIADTTTKSLMQNASSNLGTTTTLAKVSITNIANTTTKNFMQNTTTDFENTTTLTKASVTNIANTTTKSLMQNATTYLGTTTTLAKVSITNIRNTTTTLMKNLVNTTTPTNASITYSLVHA